VVKGLNRQRLLQQINQMDRRELPKSTKITNGGGRRTLVFKPRVLDLEKDLTINETKKIIFSMKQYKSPGLDGIKNEFYQIYWDTIKEDLFEVLLEIFDKFEICDSHCRGMLTLLHKGGG
jgi:hypothetical protein